MIKGLLEELTRQEKARGALSGIRKMLKERPEDAEVCAAPEHLEGFLALLSHEDAKTRKNAALLLGDLAKTVGADSAEGQKVCDALYEAWQAEETKFVTASYVKAMQGYDPSPYRADIEKALRELREEEAEEADKKHLRELRAALQKLLEQEEQPRFSFREPTGKHGVLLVCAPHITSILLEAVKHTYKDAKAVEQGVYLMTDDLRDLWQIRLFQEIRFRIRFRHAKGGEKETPAERLAFSELLPLLRECYGKQTYYPFRIIVDETHPLAGKHKQIKDLAYALEEASGHKLRSSGACAVEILLQRAADKDVVFARFPGMKDPRFSYRKDVLPTAMSPVLAAQVIELLHPYLQEGAHVIDPFCGVGTLLIERNLKVPTRDTYGVDTYGEAITAARANSERAGFSFYFIHRDYFTFTSEHLLDEILTEFPRMENKPKSEVDHFYRSFFDKTSEITGAGALLFLLSTEEGIIKKQIRLHEEFQMLRQIPLRGKEQVYIVKRRG